MNEEVNLISLSDTLKTLCISYPTLYRDLKKLSITPMKVEGTREKFLTEEQFVALRIHRLGKENQASSPGAPAAPSPSLDIQPLVQDLKEANRRASEALLELERQKALSLVHKERIEEMKGLIESKEQSLRDANQARQQEREQASRVLASITSSKEQAEEQLKEERQRIEELRKASEEKEAASTEARFKAQAEAQQWKTWFIVSVAGVGAALAFIVNQLL